MEMNLRSKNNRREVVVNPEMALPGQLIRDQNDVKPFLLNGLQHLAANLRSESGATHDPVNDIKSFNRICLDGQLPEDHHLWL